MTYPPTSIPAKADSALERTKAGQQIRPAPDHRKLPTLASRFDTSSSKTTESSGISASPTWYGSSRGCEIQLFPLFPVLLDAPQAFAMMLTLAVPAARERQMEDVTLLVLWATPCLKIGHLRI